MNFWWAAQKTEGQAGRLHKKAVRRAAEKGGAGCRRGQPSGPPFSAARQPTLNVQPTGLSYSVAWRPALLCNSPAHGKFMFFIWQNSPPARLALRLVLSVMWQHTKTKVFVPIVLLHSSVATSPVVLR